MVNRARRRAAPRSSSTSSRAGLGGHASGSRRWVAGPSSSIRRWSAPPCRRPGPARSPAGALVRRDLTVRRWCPSRLAPEPRPEPVPLERAVRGVEVAVLDLDRPGRRHAHAVERAAQSPVSHCAQGRHVAHEVLELDLAAERPDDALRDSIAGRLTLTRRPRRCSRAATSMQGSERVHAARRVGTSVSDPPPLAVRVRGARPAGRRRASPRGSSAAGPGAPGRAPASSASTRRSRLRSMMSAEPIR